MTSLRATTGPLMFGVVALADANFKARLATLGSAVFPGSPADFGKLVVEETEKWGNVIRAANIKPE